MHFHDIPPDNAARRAFLRRGAALSLAAGAAPWAMNLAAMGEAAAQSGGDYKALVCVFLHGGNDHANTLVSYDQPSYDAYRNLRANIAVDRAALTGTVLNPATALPGGLQYALAPGLAPLLPVFDANRMAVLLNVGPLVQPVTKAQYTARSVPLPPKLFSHNDQQSYWQSSLPEGARTGWGGRLGDLFASGNGNATFTCISVSGNAVFLTGQNAVQYQVGSSGAIAVNGIRNPLFGSSACSTALRTLITQPRAHLLENEYTTVTRRSVESHEQLAGALAGVTLPTSFPTGNLAAQLQTVARLIAARNALGARRQVFMVSLGGFDTHDALATAHPTLMATLGNALGAFYQATVDLGVAEQVTTFTASDFGRTLVANNDGSDHGWGSMHFVLGGAVQGRRFVGTPPVVASNGPDDVGQGRLLPTMAVEQLAGTLATWLGVSAADQLAMMPNLANFSTRDLGFMA